MEQFKTFRVPETSKEQKPSYLIIALDGTFSMAGEYDPMIEAYKIVFEEQIKSEQVYAIQFGKEIGDIEPFYGAGSGDFNQLFEKILEKLNEDIKADITICVVSDGYENSDIKALKQQIDEVKQKYQIQFTSIAVGSGYPFELFQSFRDHFHNGAVSCTNVQFVERCNFNLQDSEEDSEQDSEQDPEQDPEEDFGQDSQKQEKDSDKLECRRNFIKAFEMVRSSLKQKKKVQVDQLVWEALNAKPSFYALHGSVVTSMADQLTSNEGLEINETRNLSDIAEYIQTSCSEFLKTQANEKYEGSMEQAIDMKQKAQELYKRVDQSTSQNKETVYKVIQQIEKDLIILEDIGSGKLNLQNLSDEDKTKLLSDFNPKKAEIQEVKIEESKIQEAKQVELTEEQKLEKFQKKLIDLLNEKSEVPGHMMILSIMSDLIEEAIEEKKPQKDILESFLNPKKKSLQTIQNFTKKNQQWVEQFIDCYINSQP